MAGSGEVSLCGMRGLLFPEPFEDRKHSGHQLENRDVIRIGNPPSS
jgi:hypothetical protein